MEEIRQDVCATSAAPSVASTALPTGSVAGTVASTSPFHSDEQRVAAALQLVFSAEQRRLLAVRLRALMGIGAEEETQTDERDVPVFPPPAVVGGGEERRRGEDAATEMEPCYCVEFGGQTDAMLLFGERRDCAQQTEKAERESRVSPRDVERVSACAAVATQTEEECRDVWTASTQTEPPPPCRDAGEQTAVPTAWDACAQTEEEEEAESVATQTEVCAREVCVQTEGKHERTAEVQTEGKDERTAEAQTLCCSLQLRTEEAAVQTESLPIMVDAESQSACLDACGNAPTQERYAQTDGVAASDAEVQVDSEWTESKQNTEVTARSLRLWTKRRESVCATKRRECVRDEEKRRQSVCA